MKKEFSTDQETRRDFLRKSMIAVCGSALSKKAIARETTHDSVCRPNVLFLLADQWRGQALGCAGDPNAQTPHIDKMASEGIRFSRCYSNQPVCSPFRAMLMSGRYPTRTGVYQNNILLPPEEYCIGEAFTDAGYATGYIGKWHLDGPAKPGEVKHTQGWQYFSGFNRSHHYYDGEAVYWDRKQKHSLDSGVYQPDDQTNLAMKWIAKQAENNTPWFMMLAWGPPHTPYREIPEKYLHMFDPDTFELRPNVKPNKEWDIKELRRMLQGYYAQIKALDDNTGRLMKFLKDNNLDENTIVILTADHGDMMLSQGRQYKNVIWEESINIPFVARWPKGIPSGRTTDKLLSGIDMYPTVCGLCGVPVPAEKDGYDYSHVLRGETGPECESVFLTSREQGWRGVRTSRYTYGWNCKESKPFVLYDNEKDPYQKNNLISDPNAKEVLTKMHQHLIHWLKKVNDPLFDKCIL